MTRFGWMIVGSLFAAAAAWVLAVLVQRLVLRKRATSAASWEFEAVRRLRLGEASSTFRWFEPLVDELAALERRRGRAELREKLKRNLACLDNPLPWLPEEYLAAKRLEALIGGLFGFALGCTLGGAVLGIALGIGAFAALMRMAVHDVAEKADKRTANVKRRMPFAVDLLALMLEAGGGLLESLTTLTEDLEGHPLGGELRTVTEEVRLGRPVRESLSRMQQRVPDPDIAELVFAINQGDDFGTPLAQTFRIQADEMRLKRSQWAEKEAGAAQVAIVMPGMVIMVACLLIIGAPFVLSGLYLR